MTALISSTPNLGGVLGVGIIGTGTSPFVVSYLDLSSESMIFPSLIVINNTFRMKLQTLVGASTIPQINDAVAASKNPRLTSYVITAYVHAFQLGFKILAGIAVLQIILCLRLKKVVLTGAANDNTKTRDDVEAIEMTSANDKKPEVVGEEKPVPEDEPQKSEIEVTVN